MDCDPEIFCRRLQQYVNAEMNLKEFTTGRHLHLLQSNSLAAYQRAFDYAEKERDDAWVRLREAMTPAQED